jgi:hypothetical protein
MIVLTDGTPNADDMNFNDVLEVAKKLIQKAKHSIQVMMFEMGYYDGHPSTPSNLLVRDLIDAKKRGVKVEVILEVKEGEDRTTKRNRHTGKVLSEGGVEVIYDSLFKTTHAKLMVVDGQLLLSGSTNWTYNALTTPRLYRSSALPWEKRLVDEAHRLGPFQGRGTDVDVILDLMIHDLDIIFSFVQSSVKHIHAVGVPVLTDKIDIASVRLEFQEGCVANMTASRISPEGQRRIRLFQPDGYLSLDYASQKVALFRRIFLQSQSMKPWSVYERDTSQPGVEGHSLCTYVLPSDLKSSI